MKKPLRGSDLNRGSGVELASQLGIQAKSWGPTRVLFSGTTSGAQNERASDYKVQ